MRDAEFTGSIERSSKAPNNSFLHSWTDPDDHITWDVDVGQEGDYKAVLYYTCIEENLGCELVLGMDGAGEVRCAVTKAFDPPLYNKDKERVAKSHYFMKDFTPIELGVINLKKGRGVLKLAAVKMPGKGMVDVHSLVLTRE